MDCTREDSELTMDFMIAAYHSPSSIMVVVFISVCLSQTSKKSIWTLKRITDVGGTQYIIDGRVKLKNDSQIKEFTESGIRFDNGSEVAADVIVFCTGSVSFVPWPNHYRCFLTFHSIADPFYTVRALFGDEVAENCTPIWGLNKEGEIQGTWTEFGYKGLYNMMGTSFLSD